MGSGRIETGFGNGSLCRFDGNHWVNLGRHLESFDTTVSVSPDSFFWYWTRKMTLDHNGDVWVANDGRGVGWFTFDQDTVLAKDYFSASEGHLFNIDFEQAHYCVVRDLLTDSEGNVWICNSEASPDYSGDRPIAVVPFEFIGDPEAHPDWYYLPVKNEFGSNLPEAEFYVDRIAMDSFGYKWFGGNNNTPSENKGIWILDDKTTPDSSADDQWTQLLGLPSDSITAITMDRDGVVWVGTPTGVQYFYPNQDPAFHEGQGIDLWNIPVGKGVNVITVDPQNNKWFGTTTGISVLASDNYTWLHSYTDIDGAFPSPLPGSVVQAIAFDASTGDAYIGTGKGLARLSTPYKRMGDKVTHVTIENNNPFLIGEGLHNSLDFDDSGLSETVEMKIFTVTGYLVRHLSKNEILLGWDGRNSRGELVGSGVYLLLAYDPDGNAEVGKVAVIHQ